MRSFLGKHSNIKKVQQVTKAYSLRNKVSLDTLSKAGSAMDRGGLTKAGRALDKHGCRASSVFPKGTGNAANRNGMGQHLVDDILTAPGGSVYPNRFGGIDIISPSGRGVRYDNLYNFIGFLEP